MSSTKLVVLQLTLLHPIDSLCPNRQDSCTTPLLIRRWLPLPF